MPGLFMTEPVGSFHLFLRLDGEPFHTDGSDVNVCTGCQKSASAITGQPSARNRPGTLGQTPGTSGMEGRASSVMAGPSQGGYLLL